MGEISWRWCLGFAGVALATLTCMEYLNTLPVSDADLLLLGSRHPVLMGRALQDIFHGSALRIGQAGILLGLGFAAAWLVVASAGRATILKALLKYFEEQGAFVVETGAWHFRSLLGVHFLRAALTLAAVVGIIGATVAGGAVTSDKDPSPGSALLVFLTMLLLVGLAWAVVNWFLSLASLFVVTQGKETLGAIGAAAGLCRDQLGPLLAVGFWFGLAHGTAFVIATSVVAFPLAFLAVLPGSVVLGGMLLVTLLYFAVADFLYVGRLAAYVYIAEAQEIEVPAGDTFNPPEAPILDVPQRVDPDEVILSDVPLPSES